jgi:hypothetical protein
MAGVASGVGLGVAAGVGEGVGPADGVDAAVGLAVGPRVRVGAGSGVRRGDWVARAFGVNGASVASLTAGGLGLGTAVAASRSRVRDSSPGFRPTATADPYPDSIDAAMSGLRIKAMMVVTAMPTPNPRNV